MFMFIADTANSSLHFTLPLQSNRTCVPLQTHDMTYFNIQNKRQLLKTILKTGVIFLAVIVLFSALFYMLVAAGGFGKIPGKEELSEIRNEEASLVYSSDGVLIGKYFAENRTNIRREEMPGHLVDALVATEDRRFYSHNGYDS